MIKGQLAKVYYDDGSWNYGVVKNIYDTSFDILRENGGITTVVRDGSVSIKNSKRIMGYELLTYNDKPVIAKRKKCFFGLIKGEHLPKPE